MVFTASLLDARYLWEVVENKPENLLAVSSGKALNGAPQLYEEKAGGPDISEVANPKRVRTYRQKQNDTIRFLVNGR